MKIVVAAIECAVAIVLLIAMVVVAMAQTAVIIYRTRRESR